MLRDAFGTEPPLDCPQARGLLDALLDRLAGTTAPVPALDPRIAAIVRSLRGQPPERIDLAQLARDADLSESRLMHLFREEMGVPLRRFLLSLRLQQAMRLWTPGMSLTELAQAAGFYDQPHLVRTARDMLDALPSLFADESATRVSRCCQ